MDALEYKAISAFFILLYWPSLVMVKYETFIPRLPISDYKPEQFMVMRVPLYPSGQLSSVQFFLKPS